jgi:hypothetical protein
MNVLVAIIGVAVGALTGFWLGRKGRIPRSTGTTFGADSTFFLATPGTGGFCDGRVLKEKMTGRTFHWVRHGPCQPPAGGYFELRPKPGHTSPLVPPIPKGVDHIWADADRNAPTGAKYRYELWEVHPGAGEKCLHDPEIEIGPPMFF